MNVMNVGWMKMKDDDRWWRMMTDGALGRRCNRGRTVAEDLLDGWTFKSFMVFLRFLNNISYWRKHKRVSPVISSYLDDVLPPLRLIQKSEIICVTGPHTHTHTVRSPLFNTREECYLFLSIHNWKSNAEVPSQGWGDSSSLHTHTVERAKTKDSGL